MLARIPSSVVSNFRARPARLPERSIRPAPPSPGSAAMAALPGEGGAGRIDLSGSLAGLALKFETTLLGILASMVAGLLLALVEKGEQELAAECALLAAVAEPADAP